jgi:hypothetical protein
MAAESTRLAIRMRGHVMARICHQRPARSTRTGALPTGKLTPAPARVACSDQAGGAGRAARREAPPGAVLDGPGLLRGRRRVGGVGRRAGHKKRSPASLPGDGASSEGTAVGIWGPSAAGVAARFAAKARRSNLHLTAHRRSPAGGESAGLPEGQMGRLGGTTFPSGTKVADPFAAESRRSKNEKPRSPWRGERGSLGPA